jgi:two-component system, probable response regulator PhcQ
MNLSRRSLLHPDANPLSREIAMPRIMIVDDDRNILRNLGRCIQFMPAAMLRGEAQIETFEKPHLALARAAECDFDLVIADYLMPSMHGIAFMQKMRALQPHTPRILLSAFAGILDAMEAVKRVGPVELIAMPWHDEQLQLTIARLLQGQHGYRMEPLPELRRPARLPMFAAVR